MISKRLVDAINDQIKAEFESASLYLSMAIWSARNSFFGAENFFIKQAEEEKEHAMKFVKYLLEVDAQPIMPELSKPDSDFSSLQDVFKRGLEHEKLVTSRINDLVKLSDEDEDYATNDFLQWYVTEQVEEEKSFRDIVRRLEIVKESAAGILRIDDNLAQR
ncbi:MAG TPA: ferroxidase [Kosmotogaceae bacterium]|nr:ferroxidase [Kosmotogaceae bacterium]